MDEDDFKGAMRATLAIGSIIIFAVLGIMLLIVAGWEVKAHIDKISPDPPTCVHPQQCQDKWGNLTACTVTYNADDAGHPINLPSAPPDAGK